VNRYVTADRPALVLHQVDAAGEAQPRAAVAAVRAARDPGSWRAAIAAVGHAARGTDNLLPPIIAAVEAHATLGGIASALREVFGEHREQSR
jgi:methylmalonyl-CoA mutase N-terminal domain/subunit